jgi:hypothetical protein
MNTSPAKITSSPEELNKPEELNELEEPEGLDIYILECALNLVSMYCCTRGKPHNLRNVLFQQYRLQYELNRGIIPDNTRQKFDKKYDIDSDKESDPSKRNRYQTFLIYLLDTGEFC